MRFRRRKHDTEVELNITAFLNLMVVLIPFLLLNAVFAQVAILQLNLPSDDPTEKTESDDLLPLVLEVWIYPDRLEVVDRQTGPLTIIENMADNSHDLEALQAKLVAIKEAYPDIETITLLCDPETPYELLVHTMDTVRLHSIVNNGIRISSELFPNIQLGTAPRDERHEAGDAR